MNNPLTLVNIFWHECAKGNERSAAIIYAMILNCSDSLGIDDAWKSIHDFAKHLLSGNREQHIDPNQALQQIKALAWEIHASLCQFQCPQTLDS